MSQVPISSLPPRKSFAQVAAAAHKPPIVKETSSSTNAAEAANSQAIVSSPNESQDRIIANAEPIPTTIATLDSTQTEAQEDAPLNPTSSHEPFASDNGELRPASVDSLPKRENSDTKSVASRTTLTIDEKESLRPDDSASVQAAVEDDSPPGSRVGSNPEARAFRDQLHEIERSGQPRYIAQRGPPVGPMRSAPHAGGGILYTGSPAPPMQPNPPGDLAQQVGGPPSGLAMPPDEKLIQAMASPKDRLFVLKIEQDIIDFIKDSKESFLQLPQTNSFYRMLSHRLADYYCLNHIVDETMTSVRIYRTPHCRLPPPLMPEAADGTTPPPPQQTRKIMRRGDDLGGTGSNTGENTQNASKAGSENDSDEKDAKDRTLTREEREHRYNEARARIFKDFDESQAAKDGDGSPLRNEADQSRSSSRSGFRKNKQSGGSKKKPKDDSFEARSAYSQFGNQAYATNGGSHPPETFYNAFANMNVAGGFQSAPAQAAQQYGDPAMAQHGAVPPQMQQGQWFPPQQYQQPYGIYQCMGQPGGFPQNPQQFQNYQNYTQYVSPPAGTQTTPRPGSAAPATFSQGYPSPPASGMWPQQHYQAPYGAQQPFYGYPSGNMPPQGHPQHQQMAHGYPPQQVDGQYFGPQSPGIYGQPQFNPQSQTFYPGMASPGQYPGPGQAYGGHPAQTPMRPNLQMQRQLSNASRTSGYNSPRMPYQQSPGRAPHTPHRVGQASTGQQWPVHGGSGIGAGAGAHGKSAGSTPGTTHVVVSGQPPVASQGPPGNNPPAPAA